ncbi:MAG: hypothetical protein K2J24_08195 [Muribaculaceae bacterium]|nr:hypothetical protein [Muribaculaceae bacterium]
MNRPTTNPDPQCQNSCHKRAMPALAHIAQRCTQASRLLALATIAGCLAGILCMCTNATASHVDAEAADEEGDAYHADNDIAMTVRSLTDAITVGQPLDTAEYNFRGVLTDGEGVPLYTDIQGSPGQWVVDVTTERHAVIRNLYLGDLLPDDLQAYITSTLQLGTDAIIESDEFDYDDEAELTIYRFDGGEIRFEQRAGIAPNGLEGPRLSSGVAVG